LSLDRSAWRNVDLDDLHVFEVADVRDLDLDAVVHATRRAVVGRCAVPSRARCGVLLEALLGWKTSRDLRLEQQDAVAPRDALAGLDPELVDRAGLGGGHVQ